MTKNDTETAPESEPEYGVRIIHQMTDPNTVRMQRITGDHGRPVNIPLNGFRATGMAENLARQFLQPGFEVTDPDGHIIRPPARGKDSQTAGLKLAPGESIARVGEFVARADELTGEALAGRCNLIPGGSSFRTKSKRSDMIEFLAAQVPEEEEDAVIFDDESDMPGSELQGSKQNAVDRALAAAGG